MRGLPKNCLHLVMSELVPLATPRKNWTAWMNAWMCICWQNTSVAKAILRNKNQTLRTRIYNTTGRGTQPPRSQSCQDTSIRRHNVHAGTHALYLWIPWWYTSHWAGTGRKLYSTPQNRGSRQTTPECPMLPDTKRRSHGFHTEGNDNGRSY